MIHMELTRQFGALITLVLSPRVSHAAAAVLLIGQNRKRCAVALKQDKTDERYRWKMTLQNTPRGSFVSASVRTHGLFGRGLLEAAPLRFVSGGDQAGPCLVRKLDIWLVERLNDYRGVWCVVNM